MWRRLVHMLLGAFLVVVSVQGATAQTQDELVRFYQDWRAFEMPDFTDHVPDYTAGAMSQQQRELVGWMDRLYAMDVESWPVSQQIDWHVIRAEINGLDFDHRVRRPWAKDPAYYVTIYEAQSDVPAHEGSVIHGWIDLWTYDYPLSTSDAAEMAARIGAIPGLLEEARVNLNDSNARDLWLAGDRSFRGQAGALDAFGARVAGTSRDLDRAIVAARDASDAFRMWLEAEAPSKTGPSGVGKDDYTWYMQNVHLVPYSWEEQVTIMRRELARSHASMRLEENRNRHLPALERISDTRNYDNLLNASVTAYMKFLEDEEVQTVEPWMDPSLRAVNGSFTPAATGEVRNFFLEVIYRAPDAFRPHMHHWIELARMRENPHASLIRATPQLYNIFDSRSEGLATGVEEMFMHLGLLEGQPRARELTWIMLAQRSARALSGLMLHGGEYDMEQAVTNAMKWTPRGWLTEGDLVRSEQHLYLRQPGYGTSYVTGKVQIEELLAEYAIEEGEDFTVKRFFDGFFDAGVIPIVLTRWEMTGEKHPILELGRR
jgi:hypothetical protein